MAVLPGRVRLEAPQKTDRHLLPGPGGEGGYTLGRVFMAIAFLGTVFVEPNGQVRWSLHTGTAAEELGFPSVVRGGCVGDAGPDDGSSVREANLLIALESLATVAAVTARTITATYSLLPLDDLRVGPRSDADPNLG